MTLRKNSGRCPPRAKGKRVRVVLVNGYDTAVREPLGWQADGKGGCSWERTTGSKPSSQFEIDQWEVI